VKILAIPRNVVLSGKDLSYRAEYQLKGHIVTAVQELQDRTPESVCTPADAAATKEFARGIRRDLQAQVLYQWLIAASRTLRARAAPWDVGEMGREKRPERSR
jgi:hypothetical protein